LQSIATFCRTTTVMGRSQIKYLTQILNLSRIGFESFSRISNSHFFQIPNLSKSYFKSNLKSNRDFWTNFYSSNRVSKCAQISMQIQSRLGFAHYCCASFATLIVDVAFDIMSRVKLAETIEQLYSSASDREKTNRKLYTTSLNYFRPNRSTSLYAQYIHTIIQYNTKFVKRHVAVASEALANRTVKKH